MRAETTGTASRCAGRVRGKDCAQDEHERTAEQQTREWRDHDERRGLLDARRLDRVDAALDQSGADETADECVRRRRRNPEVPREEIPDDGGEQGGEHDGNAVVLRLDRLSDGVGDRGSDHEEREEVPPGGPHDCDLGLEDVCRDHGGDGVRRIVESVREIEQRRERDDADHCECCEVHSIQSDRRPMPDGVCGRPIRDSSDGIHPAVTPADDLSESRLGGSRRGFGLLGQFAYD